jgi:glyoxylate/hydroxypyruvate reductase A
MQGNYMKILFYGHSGQAEQWISRVQEQFPAAEIRTWQPGDDGSADYLIARNPPPALLGDREGLKAVFNLGAGVDALMRSLADPSVSLPASVAIIRLDDAGMGSQMVEYVVHAVLHYFRRFDEYEQLLREGQWQQVPPREKRDFPVGIMGLGVLGGQIADALAAYGFVLRGWSRSPREHASMRCHAGSAALPEFLGGLKCLVNLLPLTPETENILDRALFARLEHGAYLVNVARGAHLVEEDLLAAVRCGQIAGARLDVARTEPLPADHAFWKEPRISITPHISALTRLEDSVVQIAEKIRALESGGQVNGVVIRERGY